MLVWPATSVIGIPAVNPLQLLLSVDKANLRVSVVPKGDPEVKVMLSEAFPPGGQNPPGTGEVPLSVMVPTNGEPLFFTVKKPVSTDEPGGALSVPSIQIFPLLLQICVSVGALQSAVEAQRYWVVIATLPSGAVAVTPEPMPLSKLYTDSKPVGATA